LKGFPERNGAPRIRESFFMSPTPQHNEQAIEPAFLSIRACCQFLDLSAATLYRLIGLGRLKAVKAGGRTLIVTPSARDYAASLPPAKIKPPPHNRMGAGAKPVRQRKQLASKARKRAAETINPQSPEAA
jgi:hypothetical protein